MPLRYQVIVNGQTDTASRDFDEAVQALVDGHKNGAKIHIRVCTKGRQQRDLSAREANEFLKAARTLILRETT